MQSITFKTPKTIILITLTLAAMFLLLQPASTHAEAVQLAPPAQDGLTDSAELEAFMDAYLAEQMAEHHIPGVVVTFVKDDEVFFSKGYGNADLASQTPMDTEQTVLTTASVGKAFTALAVLQLVDDGLIDLNEDVRPYIDDFDLPNNFPETLTFANLLTHTDGFETRLIGAATFSEEDLRPLNETLADFTPAQIYPPGKYMTYGNFAANLAGYLVAEISGMPFEQYMADRVLTPLGMNNSTFDQRLSPEMKARMATGYEFENGEQVTMPLFYINNAPEGGLRTTAADMNQFMLMLLNGGEHNGEQILQASTVEMMFSQQFAPHPQMGGITYGLFEHLQNGRQIFLRDGDGVGTKSRVVFMPEQDLGFYISYNSGDNALRLEIVGDFLDHYYPATAAQTATPLANHQERATQFAGTYQILQADQTTFAKSMYFFDQQITITANDAGYLVAQPTGMGDVMGGFGDESSQWVEVAPLYFERVDGQGQIAFAQDEDGNITQLFSGQGYHSVFSKLAWYETQRFHRPFIAAVALILLTAVFATFVIWPLATVRQKLRGQSAPAPTSWVTVAARLWAGAVGGMLLLFVVRAVGVLYAIDQIAGMPNFVWGISEEMISALNSIYLPILLAFALPIFTLLAWGNRWWQFPARIHYTLVTLAMFGGVWWVWYWNLLGFQI